MSWDRRQCSGEYFPNLAGQTWRYIYIQLKDYKEGRRNNTIMSPMAATLSREDMINIANFYAGQKVKANPFQTDEKKVKLGKDKADQTLCAMCHLGAFLAKTKYLESPGSNMITWCSNCAISRRAPEPTMREI